MRLGETGMEWSIRSILYTPIAGIILCMHPVNERWRCSVPSQWETMLQSNIIFHWLGTYTKWSLIRYSHSVCIQYCFDVVALYFMPNSCQLCTHVLQGCFTDTWAIMIYNRPISQIPQYIRQISHNASFCNRNVHMCAHFCYKMVHCGIWDWCIVGLVQKVYCPSASG